MEKLETMNLNGESMGEAWPCLKDIVILATRTFLASRQLYQSKYIWRILAEKIPSYLPSVAMCMSDIRTSVYHCRLIENHNFSWVFVGFLFFIFVSFFVVAFFWGGGVGGVVFVFVFVFCFLVGFFVFVFFNPTLWTLNQIRMSHDLSYL